MSSSLLKSMLTTILSFISTTSNLSYTLHPLHSIIPMAHLLVPISTVISYPSLCTIHPTFNLILNTPISLPSRPCIPIKIFHAHILCPSFISYTHHTHSSLSTFNLIHACLTKPLLVSHADVGTMHGNN